MSDARELKALADQLENAIDSVGLAQVLELLEDVCHAKAEHLGTNWQSVSGGQAWDRAGAAIARVRVGVAVINVS